MEQRKKGFQMTDDFPPWKLQFLDSMLVFMGASNGPGCSHGRYQRRTHHILQGHGSVRNGWILVSLGARAAWREERCWRLILWNSHTLRASLGLVGQVMYLRLFELLKP